MRLCLSLFFGFLVAFFAPFASAEEVPNGAVEHQKLMVELSASQPVLVEAPFYFQAFALDEIEGLQVRFHHLDGWTNWGTLALEEESLKGSELRFVSSSDAFQLLADKDRTVQVTIMDLLHQERAVASIAQVSLEDSFDAIVAASDTSHFRIIPRSAWGANEALRTYVPSESDDEGSSQNVCAPLEQAYPGQFQLQDKVVYFDDYGRSLIWPQTYSQKVKKIVIHHTAGTVEDLNEDGHINARDYRLAVQAIYTYHTVSRGWGDIGYHYLVDPDGNVYEGKAGGKDVIGAHVLCQNSNTVGIAVMGNFDEQRLSEKSFEGLVNITKYVSELYNINPMGKSSFRGEVLPNIVTHGEVGELTKSYIGQGATACPGAFLKREMTRLRQVVADGGIAPDVGFDVVDSDTRLQVSPLQTFDWGVTLNNSGQQMWTSLELLNGRETVFKKESLLLASGQSTHLDIPLQSTLDAGRKQMNLVVMINGQRMSRTLDLDYIVERPQYRYRLVGTTGNTGTLLIGEKRSVSVTLENTSNFPWLNSGSHQVQVQQVLKRGNQLAIVPRGVSFFLSQPVPVGGQVTLNLDLPVQRSEGEFDLSLSPVIGRELAFSGAAIDFHLSVEKPRFVAEVRPVDPRVTIAKGFEQEVPFELVNNGNFDWEAGMVWLMFEDGERITLHSPLAVGQSVSYPVMVRAGYQDRVVVVTGRVGMNRVPGILSGLRLRTSEARFTEEIRTVGRVTLAAEWRGQSVEQLVSDSGNQEVWVDVLNTGTVPWYADGQDAVVLTLADKPDFAHSSWISRNIAARLSQKIVRPGETARFSFMLRVGREQRRTISDTFVLMAGDQYVRIRGGSIRFELTGKLPELREVNDEASDSGYQPPDTNSQTSAAGNQASSTQIPEMRVWLTEVDQPVLEVTSPGQFVVWDSASTVVKTFAANQVFSVTDEDVQNGTVYRLRAKASPYLQFQNWNRIRAFGNNIDDNRFRGVLEFRWDDGKMIAINELPLEDYMKGIAEVPETDDQPTEKRKTIAVLARSYALHYLISGYQKFPGKPYNAADSPALFQKYNGYSFELRSPKWQQAVEDTSEEVVLVNDSQWSIVESQSTRDNRPLLSKDVDRVLRAAYFSCTDGSRTKSWNEVWPDNEYFQRFGEVFQSVSDPLGDDPTRQGSQACGHQVGLSGYGATQKAAAGESYRDIIEYYYSGVEVGKY